MKGRKKERAKQKNSPECKPYRFNYTNNRYYCTLQVLKLLPSLISSNVTMIHHNSMLDKDCKEAALEA